MSKKTIDCGIGNIEYESPNNLLLVQLMENLEMAIKQSTPKEVNALLERFIGQ